jgi:putative ABC transport system permease protein
MSGGQGLPSTPMTLTWRHALRRLRRAAQAGELRILALAMVVAVAAASAVGLFSERMQGALAAQSGDTLGADAVATSRQPIPAAILDAARAAGLRTSAFVTFPSLLIAGEASALASVKGVEPNFPLRGELRSADQPYGVARAMAHGPAPGEAWADVRLWTELGLEPGAEIQVGAVRLRLRAVLENEPGAGMGFNDLAPRLLINLQDVAATQLIGPGSRVRYGLLLAGDAQAIAQLQQIPLQAPLNWTDPQNARPEVRNAIERSGQFLDISVLAAALLAAAAIGLAAHQHGARLRDEVALLKCLGARQGFILRSLLLNLLLLGLGSALIGAALGYAGQAILAALLGGLIDNLVLPPPSPAPVFIAVALGLLVLLGFGLPPVLEARRVPPLRVLQRNLAETPRTRLVWLAAAGSVLTLLAWQTRDAALALRVLGGALVTLGVLALLAWILVAVLKPLQRRAGLAWRFGLGNVARRRGSTVAQIVALGLGLLALLLVTVVRQDLLDSWRNRLPGDTPNVFLINIQTEQLPGLRAFFAERGYAGLEYWPMARGRLVALNDQPVSAEMFDDPETQRWINRDFNLSWTDHIGPDNTVVEGDWWGAEGRGRHWLSADTYAVERLGLKLGDSMTLQFADQRVTLTVHNLREVRWDSFKPNFFLLAPPGVIDTVPAQWLSSFYLPRDKRALLRELTGRFPNVTALDIDALMNQVRSIMARIVRAVEFMLLFTLAAGVVVLLAAIEGTRGERARETALLRTLGARTPVLVKGLLAEFAVLGGLAGLVAAIAAQAVTWVLAAQVFEIPYGPRPWLWLIGGLSGALLVTLLGWLSLRGVLATPPTRVLQSA